MLVRRGERSELDAPAKAEAADNVLTRDYYTQLPQIRLTGSPAAHAAKAEMPVDVTLDGNDVARLVECAVRHPAPNMRYAVLAAIWNHPDSFRQIFRFGLEAPDAFSDIRQIVSEELARRSAGREDPAASGGEQGGKTLLPRMPLPAHLKDRGQRS